MRRLLLFFCCLTLSCFAEEEREHLSPSMPEQWAALSSPDLIGGLVSPLDGHLVLRERDLTAVGAEPIVLNRVYVAPFMPCDFLGPGRYPCRDDYHRKYLLQHLLRHYIGWQLFFHQRAQLNWETRELLICEPSGGVLSFSLVNGKAVLAAPSYGMSNWGPDGPSGRYDPRNTKVDYRGDNIVVEGADGTVRFYSKLQKRVNLQTDLYLLDWERLLNGRIIRYSYREDGVLTRVESLDPKEQYVYAALDFEGSLGECHCSVASNTGLKADYQYERRRMDVRIKHAGHREEIRALQPPILRSVSSPNYRFEEICHNDCLLIDSYSGKEQQCRVQYGGFGSPQDYRVQKLLLPTGDGFEPVYEMAYDPPVAGERGGSTRVRRVDGSVEVTHFSKELLPTLIESFNERGELKRKRHFLWTESQWLKEVEVCGGSNGLLYRKSYEYDPFGNPVLERLFGDLTGSGVNASYTIRREFSQDGRHLLLKEEHENGKEVTYAYLPNTNLMTKREVKDRGRVLSTDLFTYDDDHNLVEAVSDDGTRRRITRTTLRQEASFLHMPEWIEELYLEEGSERLLKKRHLIYDKQGNVAREELYDANGQFAYAIEREFNERGDLLFETNPLGQKASYDYTDRGYCDFETSFSNRLETTRSYDLRGRLREERSVGDDGIDHRTYWGYDFHDRPIEKIDSFGNQTSYAYDSLSNGVTRSQFPSIASPFQGPVSVVTRATYDALGRKIEETDANAHTTQYRYNAYGSIAEIIYPDSIRESYRYEKDGRLARYTDPDGLTISYTRDLLDNPLSKSYYSPEGELLAQESFTYDGSRLLSETDREGNLTRYFYDGAGRRVGEDRSGRLTEFSYDPLGRLSRVSYKGGRTIDYDRDLEGRVLEERRNDLDRVSYTYDRDGHLATTTRWISGEESTHCLTYDSFGRLIEKEEPTSTITQISYDENQINSLGQRVLEVGTTDPLGMATIETRDAFNRTVKREVFDPQGATLSSQGLIYDPHGNLIHRKDFVYEDGEPTGSQTLRYSYTVTNRLSGWVQGEDQRTSYAYTPSGKIKMKCTAGPLFLSYGYDSLGYLSELSSSGISHKFRHNKLGHLVYAADEKSGVTIEREVDPFGNVTCESISGRPAVEKEYDDFDRLTLLKIDGIGEVAYHYDPLFLREVVRLSSNEQPLYRHRYEEYDESGYLLSEQLIGNLGRVVHETNVRGQKGSISGPHFAQGCRYDSVGNLIETTIDGQKSHYGYDGLSQLTSEEGQSYRYDSVYNRTQKNGARSKFNNRNQLVDLSYDSRGNQLTHGESQLSYDSLDRLVEAISGDKKITFSYDPLGRRIEKRVYQKEKEVDRESYLYDGQDEIGALSPDGSAKNFRVLGLNGATIAIELEGRPFAPLLDVQGNIRQLMDLETRVVHRHKFTAFGEELQVELPENPWRFASKRFDSDLNLIHFGKRDYDPKSARWLTRDPAGFVDSVNLYQYVFNNPFFYTDPDGQFAFAIPLVWIIGGAISLPTIKAVLGGALVVGIVHQTHKLYQNRNTKEQADSKSDTLWKDNAEKHQRSKMEKRRKKGDIKEGLSTDPFNDPNLENVEGHPKAEAQGRHTFRDKKTGEVIEYDEGKSGHAGHEGHNHYHHPNPSSKGDHDKYLDAKGNPVRRGHDKSHLYPPEWVWW